MPLSSDLLILLQSPPATYPHKPETWFLPVSRERLTLRDALRPTSGRLLPKVRNIPVFEQRLKKTVRHLILLTLENHLKDDIRVNQNLHTPYFSLIYSSLSSSAEQFDGLSTVCRAKKPSGVSPRAFTCSQSFSLRL